MRMGVRDPHIRQEPAVRPQDGGSTVLLIEIHAEMATARTVSDFLERSKVRLLRRFPKQHQLVIPDLQPKGMLVLFAAGAHGQHEVGLRRPG